MGKIRLYFVTDVHGSNVCFRKFLNAAKFYKVDVLILGGDITGKSFVPIVSEPDGSFTCNYAGDAMHLKDRTAAENLAKEMEDAGAYTKIIGKKEYEELEAKPDLVTRTFNELMLESVARWTRLAEARLKGTGVSCFVSPGNDDIFEIDRILDSSSLIVNPEEKVVDIGGNHEMITLGYANHTPWHSPRELDEPGLESKINKMAASVKDMQNTIFNLHVPPINTSLDQAPKVTDDLKPVVSAGHVEMTSAGSSATRDAIQRYQPLLGLHGHIHESKGFVKIGKTLCLNPGSEYGQGILRGVVTQLEDRKVKSYMITSG